MSDLQRWPDWATAEVNQLCRAEARKHLQAAQGFWRDFALAGLTIGELCEVIEERRRKGPGVRLTVPARPVPRASKPTMACPDHSLFDDFPALNPEDERWLHA